MPGSDVVVVGGGVVGLATAWRAAQRGLSVSVADPAPGRGASWAAAGMLAPVTEVHYGEEALLALNLEAARRWKAFAEELATCAGSNVGYRECGTLLVAWDEDDRAWAQQLHAFQAELGLRVEWLTGRAARTMVPDLAPGIRSAIWAPDDHQVDNRRLLGALLGALARSDVELVERRVSAVDLEHGAVQGVTLEDGRRIETGKVVLAAGCDSAHVAGLPSGALPDVRPVKGQILRLGPAPGGPRLEHSVRAVVEGASVYVVPRADGTVVVGATSEERGHDTTVTVAAVYELLRDARRVVPSLGEMLMDEASAGLRPASPDNGPLVGPVEGLDTLVVATGHYRNGILQAPLTADAVAGSLVGEPLAPLWRAFSPGRSVGTTC